MDLNVGQSAVSPAAQALADVQLGCFIGRNSKHPQDFPGLGQCWQSAQMGWLLFGCSNLSMSVALYVLKSQHTCVLVSFGVSGTVSLLKGKL